MNLRSDQALIAEWIRPGTRVLDLGCGDGSLLEYLTRERFVAGYGVEIDKANILSCIERGVSVVEADIDRGLSGYFDDNSFDYVIMTQTLQATRYPHLLLKDMLRVGCEGIVTFPNMGHWRARLQILFGHMPVTKALPARWYDTDNLHLCTVSDFENLCSEQDVEILDRTVVDHAHRQNVRTRALPNLFGELALYRFRSRSNPAC